MTETREIASLPELLARVRTLIEAGRKEEARALLGGAGRFPPADAQAWRALGNAWAAAGDAARASAAQREAFVTAAREPDMVAAADALAKGDPAQAARLLAARLQRFPKDAAALLMQGDIALRANRLDDAEQLFARALLTAPDLRPARHGLAVALYRQARTAEALQQLEPLLADPADGRARALKAALLLQRGDYDEGIALTRALLADAPGQPRLWLSLGHALNTVGRAVESVAAYREALAREPGLGEAWWSLANLKTFRFADADMAAMETAVASGGRDAGQRIQTEFALGKALEDRGDYTRSFAHYAAGNRRQRARTPYDPEEIAALAARSEAFFASPGFARREGGHPSAEPIFVVGLPRSGSTLIEQILASHPEVEGTRELPYLPGIAKALDARRTKAERGRYPEAIGALDDTAARALGQEYLDRAQPHRKTGRPFFIDKQPNNWLHLGLIARILPNARIVDARRHPLAAGFACFKQYFAHGQAFAYDLGELGRYYADYVRLTAAFDRAPPGRVVQVRYERLVRDTEGEVRALLAALGLPFDPACLRFWETDRAVRTPSAGQVRRPIFADALDRWRRYEPWLDPLKAALGPALDDYPDA